MIRTARAHLNVEAQSHPGMTGKNNEDRYAVASFMLADNNKVPVLFAVLADGIGGHRGGEVAAELAVNHIMQEVAHSDGRHTRQIIERAIHEASDAIAAHAASNETLKGMGATCAAAWIIGDRLHTVYVGDSRIYLVRGGRIQQLTVDHTWVQEAIEKGILTPEMAREHPNVHVIRRYLGSPTPPEPDFRMKLFDDEGDRHAEGNQGVQLLPEDVLLLCSDGLTDLVWNDEILEVIRSKPNIKEAAHALIELANSRGGHDNITVVLISAPLNFKPVAKSGPDWLPWIVGGAAGVVFVLAMAAFLTLSLLRQNTDSTLTPTVSPSPLPTQTPLLQATATLRPLPTATSVPLLLPVAPTYTPWPTNTVIP
ncbi:MAG TPA: PP2C family serine/threonine-protein phosphatase [Anaerolineales bacterium]|nr:PP2C family serine/threonine-protein phosphatase [Anaerolineales bacterium]